MVFLTDWSRRASWTKGEFPHFLKHWSWGFPSAMLSVGNAGELFFFIPKEWRILLLLFLLWFWACVQAQWSRGAALDYCDALFQVLMDIRGELLIWRKLTISFSKHIRLGAWGFHGAKTFQDISQGSLFSTEGKEWAAFSMICSASGIGLKPHLGGKWRLHQARGSYYSPNPVTFPGAEVKGCVDIKAWACKLTSVK